MEKPASAPQTLHDEAVRRFARLRSGEADGRGGVTDEWLAADPSHRAAFEEVAEHWADLGALRDDPQMLFLRESARRDLRRSQLRRVVVGAVAASLAAVAVLAAVWAPRGYDHFVYEQARHRAVTYSTSVGQLTQVRLSDGTVATLDTDSVMRAWQVRNGRFVELVKGRARFQVAKDPARPFAVLAAGKSVTALGTDFSVYLRPEAMTVSLVEGRLRVRAQDAGQTIPSVDMTAGYRLTTNGRSWGLTKTNTAADVSWTDQQLIFEGATLQDIAGEMNRYSKSKIVIRDRAVQQLRMSAVLRSTDLQSFLDAVDELSLARVEPTQGGYELRER